MPFVAPVLNLDGTLASPLQLRRGSLRPTTDINSIEPALAANFSQFSLFWHLDESVDLNSARYALHTDLGLLRVFGFDTVAAIQIFNVGSPVIQGMTFAHLATWGPWLSVRATVDETTRGRLLSFVSAMNSLGFTCPAFRWYTQAPERPYALDRYVNYVITLESALCGDSTSESTWRLSSRAALLLANSDQVAGELFDLIRKAYGIRSKLLHGSQPKQSESEFATIDPSYVEPADRLRSIARRALLAVHFDNPAGDKSMDSVWRALVCSGPLRLGSDTFTRDRLLRAIATVFPLPMDDVVFHS
jgi:hypothetical protein